MSIKWIFKKMPHQRMAATYYSFPMQDNLNIIVEFANTISGVIRQFAELCREHSRKLQETRPEFEEVRNQLIRERKKRMELEQIIRQRVSGSQSDQLLTDVAGGQQERKRPRTAFTLFVTDQRDKILREHPTLDLHKVTTLALIKWKKLSREQQLVYEKKLEEMNKITERQYAESRNKMLANADGYFVKKQFGCENENQNGNEHNQQRQQHQKSRQQQNNINNNINATMVDHYQENPIPATLPSEDKPQQAQQERQPREKGVIQNMLDLFHTQIEQNYRQEAIVPHVQNTQQDLQPPMNLQPVAVPTEAVNASPSLQIVEAANQNHPIVIPPTIQQ